MPVEAKTGIGFDRTIGAQDGNFAKFRVGLPTALPQPESFLHLYFRKSRKNVVILQSPAELQSFVKLNSIIFDKFKHTIGPLIPVEIGGITCQAFVHDLQIATAGVAGFLIKEGHSQNSQAENDFANEYERQKNAFRDQQIEKAVLSRRDTLRVVNLLTSLGIISRKSGGTGPYSGEYITDDDSNTGKKVIDEATFWKILTSLNPDDTIDNSV